MVRNRDTCVTHFDQFGELGIILDVLLRTESHSNIIPPKGHIVNKTAIVIDGVDGDLCGDAIVLPFHDAENAGFGVVCLDVGKHHPSEHGFRELEVVHDDLQRSQHRRFLLLHSLTGDVHAGMTQSTFVHVADEQHVCGGTVGSMNNAGRNLVRLDFFERLRATTTNDNQASFSTTRLQLLRRRGDELPFLGLPAAIRGGVDDVQFLRRELVELFLRRNQRLDHAHSNPGEEIREERDDAEFAGFVSANRQLDITRKLTIFHSTAFGRREYHTRLLGECFRFGGLHRLFRHFVHVARLFIEEAPDRFKGAIFVDNDIVGIVVVF